MPRVLLTLLALSLSIVAAAGCGNDGSSSSSDAASLAPAGSFVYAEATLRPEGEQKEAIDDLVSKFPGEGSAGERIRQLLDEAIAESDSELSYEEDIEPWVGDEAALFVSGLDASGGDPDAAGMVATEDEDATVEMIEKEEEDAQKTDYKGRDLYVFTEGESAGAVVDGWLVLGNPGGVKAAIDTAEGGEAIEGDEDFKSTLRDASDDRLGFMYMDLPGLYEELGKLPQAAAAMSAFREMFKQPVLVTADADENGIRFEGSLPVSALAGLPFGSGGGASVDGLPADSWGAMAQADLGQTLQGYLDMFATAPAVRQAIERGLRRETGLDLERDVLSWMGDWGVFVRGESLPELNGAVVVETSDEAASGRFIDGIVRLARREAEPGVRVGPLQVPGGGEGATLRSPEVPEPVHLLQRDGKVVLAYGDSAAQDAFDPAETLGDSPELADAEAALGGDYNVAFYMQIEPILSLIEPAVAAEGGAEQFQKAKPYLEPLGALVGGTREDGDKLLSAFGLTVK